MVVYLIVTKLIDSGLGIFVIIATAIVGLVFVATRDLDSKDRLAFLNHFVDNRLLAWSGWFVAAGTIILAWRLLRKQQEWHERELKRVDEVKEKALQSTLDLQESKPGKQLKT